MSGLEDSTRPLSVAELLARNGTIGSPPVGGRRRRRRRNSDGVSVAELTGEIPVVGAGEPVVGDEEDEAGYEEPATEYAADGEIFDDEVDIEDGEVDTEDNEIYSGFGEADIDEVDGELGYTEGVDYTEDRAPAAIVDLSTGLSAELVHVETDDSVMVGDDASVAEVVHASAVESDMVVYGPADTVEEPTRPEAPPRSTDPMPRRSQSSTGPERGHDPRPQRRSSGAEQMSYDPVDQSVDLSELVDQQGAEELRSYLQTSGGTLFSGGTVADDLARRGLITSEEHPGYHSDNSSEDYAGAEYANSDFDYGGEDQQYSDNHETDYPEDDLAVIPSATVSRPKRFVETLWNAAVAILQSLLAVVLGAGLFIGFDHLWRWNRLVALVLTVLVVLSLAAGVRIVRKTEDIVSTLTAVAVGLLVTLGPLALQST